MNHQLENMNEELTAMRAYFAYGLAVNFKNYQGSDMPEWGSLPQSIKQAWIAAVRAVIEATENKEDA